jgi:hypothetical protein
MVCYNEENPERLLNRSTAVPLEHRHADDSSLLLFHGSSAVARAKSIRLCRLCNNRWDLAASATAYTSGYGFGNQRLQKLGVSGAAGGGSLSVTLASHARTLMSKDLKPGDVMVYYGCGDAAEAVTCALNHAIRLIIAFEKEPQLLELAKDRFEQASASGGIKSPILFVEGDFREYTSSSIRELVAGEGGGGPVLESTTFHLYSIAQNGPAAYEFFMTTAISFGLGTSLSMWDNMWWAGTQHDENGGDALFLNFSSGTSHPTFLRSSNSQHKMSTKVVVVPDVEQHSPCRMLIYSADSYNSEE